MFADTAKGQARARTRASPFQAVGLAVCLGHAHTGGSGDGEHDAQETRTHTSRGNADQQPGPREFGGGASRPPAGASLHMKIRVR